MHMHDRGEFCPPGTCSYYPIGPGPESDYFGGFRNPEKQMTNSPSKPSQMRGTITNIVAIAVLFGVAVLVYMYVF